MQYPPTHPIGFILEATVDHGVAGKATVPARFIKEVERLIKQFETMSAEFEALRRENQVASCQRCETIEGMFTGNAVDPKQAERTRLLGEINTALGELAKLETE